MGEPVDRRRLPAAVVFALLLAVTGCAASRSSAAAERPSAFVEPAGTTATLRRDGLEFSAHVASTTLSAGDVLDVQLTLRNVSDEVVHWTDFRFGLAVFTDYQANPGNPDGMYMGLPPHGPGGSPSGPMAGPPGIPFVLPPGDSTSTVISTSVTEATWNVLGIYYADADTVSAQTPTITVIARP
jgi:hypothetical protein